MVAAMGTLMASMTISITSALASIGATFLVPVVAIAMLADGDAEAGELAFDLLVLRRHAGGLAGRR